MRKILTITFLLLLASCHFQKVDFQKNDLSFNSKIWKTADKRVKGKMAYDLQNSKQLINKTTGEVEEILGKADFQTAKDHWIYLIDIGEGYDYYFNVRFDEKIDKVKSNYVGD